MKKSLIALAVLAAAGAASAQSSVTLYGRLDLGMSSTKVTSGTTTTKSTDYFGAQNSRTTSRLGVKGEEDLGGGTKAFFNYEFAINPDVTTSVGNTRLANLGVQGGFGRVIIGTYMNGLDATRGIGAAADNGAGYGGEHTENLLSLVGANGTSTIPNAYVSGRSQNAISYGAAFGPVRAAVGLTGSKSETTTSGVKTAEAKTSGAQVYVGYASGPISANLAYAAGKANTGLTSASEFKTTDLAVSGSYDLGFVKPYAIYETVKSKIGGTTYDKANAWLLGAGFTFDAFQPYVQYGQAKAKVVNFANVTTANKGTAWQVGSKYNLSKRTYAYGMYGQDKIKGTSTKETGFSLGLVHQF